MVSIILTILKIIGISLLVILGIMILLIVLVLFVPLKYKANGGYKNNNTDVRGKISWLMGVVSLTAQFESGQPFQIKVKVFWVTVFDNLKKGHANRKRKSERKHNQASREKKQLQAASILEEEAEKSVPEEINRVETHTEETHTEESSVREHFSEESMGSERTADEVEEDRIDDKKIEKKTIFQKIKAFFVKLVEFIENIKFTFHKICAIIRKIRDNIKYYWELLQQESTKQVFHLCTKQLSRIFKNIAPKKYEVKLHLGFEDPAVMGNVLAVWGMLYPFHMGKVDIQPEFDQKVMEGSFRLKGRVSIYILLWMVWLFMTDKNIKRLRKQLGI